MLHETLLTDLFLSDQQTRGLPVLLDTDLEPARACLRDLLTDPDHLDEYLKRLLERYRAVAGGKHIGFTHCALLDEANTSALLACGPESLAPEALAEVLLSPFALKELAEQIREETPDWWLEPLTEAGRALMVRYGIEFALPAIPELTVGVFSLMNKGTVRQNGRTIDIGFTPESIAVQQQMARELLGDANASFTLALHRRESVGDAGDAVELEMTPAPTQGSWSLRVDINGQVRTFVLEVPYAMRMDLEAVARCLARAAEPVPTAAFEMKGEAEWTTEGTLILRRRNGTNPQLLNRSEIA